MGGEGGPCVRGGKRARAPSPGAALAADSLQMLGSARTEKRKRSVSFSHVSIRSHLLELWGGGGVPGDGGAPLGLGWTVAGERRVTIDDFEETRRSTRRVKEEYGSLGCVEASRRCELLIGAGSSLKQIRAVKQAVARLNRQRWQASALLFRDAWLFSAPSGTDPLDVLCVLGTPNAEPLLLAAGAWRSAAAFAESLRPILPPETLLTLDADEGYLSIDWEALSEALAAVVRKRRLVL